MLLQMKFVIPGETGKPQDRGLRAGRYHQLRPQQVWQQQDAFGLHKVRYTFLCINLNMMFRVPGEVNIWLRERIGSQNLPSSK